MAARLHAQTPCVAPRHVGTAPRMHTPLRAAAEPASAADSLLVCIGKTCRLEGSQQTLDIFRELAGDAGLRVANATCMGRCGGGPHLSLRPSGEEVDAMVGVDACAALLRRCRPDDGLEARLAALRLRTEGEAAVASGQHSEAERLLTAALEQRADLHVARLARAAARTELGAHDAALEDAAFVAADAAAPTKTRARAHVAAARVHAARKHSPAAGAALATAAAVDPSIVRAKEYTALAAEVRALDMA